VHEVGVSVALGDFSAPTQRSQPTIEETDNAAASASNHWRKRLGRSQRNSDAEVRVEPVAQGSDRPGDLGCGLDARAEVDAWRIEETVRTQPA
jgi:hypothetical protein